jgi:nucleoside-diphosphate kinase
MGPPLLVVQPARGYKPARVVPSSRRLTNPSFKPERQDFMAIERTFSMIKPDATRRNLTGAITAKLEAAGLRVIASKRVWMSRRQAEGFYAVHKDRPFFGELVDSMSAAPTIVQVLEGENAILKNREVMGATNPANAAEGTIRKEFALSIGENSVHGSDAPETAAVEIAYWFSETEIVG